jgi:UDP-N-acetylglucosamine 2-epimerase (non-hydrolysing)
MPEEINRLATDAISDLLLVSEPAGEINLRNEGVPEARILYVGNVMIDTLVHHLPQAREQAQQDGPGGDYALVTLHRPSNVDSRESLAAIADFLAEIARRLRVVFPIHPRTKARLAEFGLMAGMAEAGITLLPPQGYIENLGLMSGARLVLTDSGGIQEETSYLSVPCLTLRENTERPSTVSHGTNTLIGRDFVLGLRLVDDILGGRYRKSGGIPGWDGHASERVVAAIGDFLEIRRCSTAAS